MQIISGIQQKATKCVCYGPEGIGKSTFASQSPDPLFIDTEDSTLRMNVKRLPKPNSSAMVLEEIRYVRDTPGICRTLVLDTADWAERLCREAVCARYHKAGLEDFGYGKGYSYVYEDMGKILNALDEVIDRGIHVIVNAHAAMRKFEQPNEDGAYDRWELKLINAQKCNIANMLKEWADVVLFANYETIVIKNEEKKAKAHGGRRVMYTAHHPCWDAKNRFGLAEKLPFEFQQVAHCFPEIGAAPQAHNYSTIGPGTQRENPQMDGPSLPGTTQTSLFDTTGIPQALLDLMKLQNVTEEEIRTAVAKKGYYPKDTPIKNYDPQFVTGVLVGAWPQVYQMIKESN